MSGLFRFHLVFFVSLSFFALPISVAANWQGPVIDVSGGPGENGRHGKSYLGYVAPKGQPGPDGGDASPAYPGENAALIRGAFTYQGESPVSYGYIQHPDGSRGDFRVYISDPRTEHFHFFGQGGCGGIGGYGGCGGGGGRGSTGSSATPSSAAGDGGPGLPGGDSGLGSDGARGGNGSSAGFRVHERHLELLAFPNFRLGAGAGGDFFGHGLCGPGGEGGRGGSGCSWTTTTTDKDGKTTTHYHSRPGGSKGPTGPDGETSTKPLFKGTDGVPGESHYWVYRENNGAPFHERVEQGFRFAVSGDVLSSANPDGVLEFGERVTLKGLTVTNIGDVETPHTSEIAMYLRWGEFIIGNASLGQKFTLPYKLQPGQSHTFTQAIEFRIVERPRDMVPAIEMTEIDGLVPVFELVDFQRTFDNGSSKQVIPVRINYPVRISVVGLKPHLAPGEATQMIIRVENTSSQPVGGSSEIGRLVQVYLTSLGGDVSGMEMVDYESGEIFRLTLNQGMFRDLHLDPYEVKDIPAQIAINGSAVPYTSEAVTLTLGLGKLEDPTQIKEVQSAIARVNVAATFPKDGGGPDIDIVVVSNGSMRPEVYREWQRFGERRGKNIQFYDPDYYGYIDFLEQMGDGYPRSSLAQKLAGKTVIVLNTPLDFGDGKDHYASELLDRVQVQRAASEYGIGFYTAGPEPYFGEINLTAPSLLDGVTSFLTQEAATNWQPQGATDEAHYVQVTHVFVAARGSFIKPNHTHLTRVAEEMHRKLQREHPDKNIIFDVEFTPEFLRRREVHIPLLPTLRGRLFGSRYNLGQVKFRRALDPRTPGGFDERAPAHDVMSAAFVAGFENAYNYAMTLSDVDLVASLERVVRNYSSTPGDSLEFEATILAIRHKIAADHIRAQSRAERRRLKYDEALSELGLLNLLGEADINLGDHTVPEVQNQILDLLARAQFYADQTVPFFKLPLNQDKRLNNVTRRYIEKILSRFFAKDAGSRGWSSKPAELKLIEDNLSLRVEGLRQSYGQRFYGTKNRFVRKIYNAFDRQGRARMRVSLPPELVRRYIRPYKMHGLMSSDEIAAFAEEHQRMDAARAAAVSAHTTQAATYLEANIPLDQRLAQMGQNKNMCSDIFDKK